MRCFERGACQASPIRLRLCGVTRLRVRVRLSWRDRLRGALRRLQIHGSRPRLLCLERSSLCRTTGHRIELSTTYQVLEVRSRREDDVHCLDVRRREVLQLVCPIAAERDPEVAELPHLHLLTFEQHLDQALAHVDDYATHRSA